MSMGDAFVLPGVVFIVSNFTDCQLIILIIVSLSIVSTKLCFSNKVIVNISKCLDFLYTENAQIVHR